jgi:hypothetical protein
MSKTNTEKLTSIISNCIKFQIPLDKAQLSIDYWNDNPRLTFDASKLSRVELQNLKRCTQFTVEGDAASGFKALVGKATAELPLELKVEKALTCKKITVDGLTVTEMDSVIENFKAGKAFIMDCEQTSGTEEESLAAEDEIPF